jgi:hypothetical protein
LLSASFAIGNLFVAAVVLTLERKLKVESRGNGLTLLSDRCIIEISKNKKDTLSTFTVHSTPRPPRPPETQETPTHQHVSGFSSTLTDQRADPR